MPKDYITKEIFEEESVFVRQEFALVRKDMREGFDSIRSEMREGFDQTNRNIGAMIEEFRDKIKVVLEGFHMQVEKVEILNIENESEHEKFNSRIARLEAKIINY